jgi:hypothetical protein
VAFVYTSDIAAFTTPVALASPVPAGRNPPWVNTSLSSTQVTNESQHKTSSAPSWSPASPPKRGLHIHAASIKLKLLQMTWRLYF